MIEDQGEKQIRKIENSVEKKYLDKDKKSVASSTYELNKIVDIKNKLNNDDLIYKTGNKTKDNTSDFRKFKTIRSFGREIYKNVLSLDDARELQIRLENDNGIFKVSTKLKESVKKEKKLLLKMQLYFLIKSKKFLMILKVKYFQKKNKEKGFQIF